jgi:hypothetical protein
MSSERFGLEKTSAIYNGRTPSKNWGRKSGAAWHKLSPHFYDCFSEKANIPASVVSPVLGRIQPKTFQDGIQTVPPR